jgi:hypothetical protein
MFIENEHVCYRFQMHSLIFKGRCGYVIKCTGRMKNRAAAKMQNIQIIHLANSS